MKPEQYFDLPEKKLIDGIKSRKTEYGKRVMILGHNYQKAQVYELADYHGDSFSLSKTAAQQEDAEFIVFCGVDFMAETAAILSQEDQQIIHPSHQASCPMAEMAQIDQVTRVWEQMGEVLNLDSVIPVCYMNSDAEIKAFCGRNDGAVCTSSNAEKIFKWALNQGEKILFIPDKYLGENTALDMGIDEQRLLLWNSSRDFGGLNKDQIKDAEIFLWDGYCHVHRWFKPSHIDKIRESYPEVDIVVHPECRREVVKKADYSGSTGFIGEFVEEAPEESVIAIGTEINMVKRLGREYSNKKIIPLSRSLCPNMSKINLYNLAYAMDNLGETNVVEIPDNIVEEAKIALERMLRIGT